MDGLVYMRRWYVNIMCLVWLHPLLVYTAPACGLWVIPIIMIAAHHFSLGSCLMVTSFDFTVNIFSHRFHSLLQVGIKF